MRPNCLEAFQARARAFKDSGRLSEAIIDLSEALNLSPQNRDLHRFMIKVKEELRQKEMSNDGNNNDKILPVGADETFKFVDDSSSIATDG